MTTKTIYMNGGMNDEENGVYIYPDSDDDDQQNCGGSECSEQEQNSQGPEYNGQGPEYNGQGPEYNGQDGYPEYLEIVPKHDDNQTNSKDGVLKNKPRSMSFDSESSDLSKRPNFKCGSCKKSFLLDKNQKMIRCIYCGYRILFKLRTRSHISYKTE